MKYNIFIPFICCTVWKGHKWPCTSSQIFYQFMDRSLYELRAAFEKKSTFFLIYRLAEKSTTNRTDLFLCVADIEDFYSHIQKKRLMIR